MKLQFSNDKFLLKGLRQKLTPKQVALFKLVLWTVMIVWMIFFLSHSIITAQILARWIPQVFPQTTFYQALGRAIPYWYVFTIGLIEFIIARWTYRKLKGTNLEKKVRNQKEENNK